MKCFHSYGGFLASGCNRWLTTILTAEAQSAQRRGSSPAGRAALLPDGRCPVNIYNRDGQMRVDGNAGSTLDCEPNSYGEWEVQPDFAKPPLELNGAAARWNHRADDDYS
jgi:catalase